MEQKKYIFIKPFKTQEGVIPEGSDLILFRDIIYLNGGMVLPYYQKILMEILNNQQLKDEYLKETYIIKNKV